MWKSFLKVGLASWFLAQATTASADTGNPFDQLKNEVFQFAEFQPVPENKFLPGKPRSRGGEKRAASRAKSEFPNSKVLSVNYMQRNDAYRVKLLSNGGVVKYVYVDQNGEVFE